MPLKNKIQQIIGMFAFWGFLAFASIWHWNNRTNRLIVPRECLVNIYVDKMFSSKNSDCASGYGTIIQTDEHLRWLRGKSVTFYLSNENSLEKIYNKKRDLFKKSNDSKSFSQEKDNLVQKNDNLEQKNDSLVQKNEDFPEKNQIISAKGVLDKITEENSKDFCSFCKSIGIVYKIHKGTFSIKEKSPEISIWKKQKLALEKILYQGSTEKTMKHANVLAGMILGDKEKLSDKQKDEFVTAGVMHLFSVSGLHIRIVGSTIFYLLMLLHFPRFIVIITQMLFLIDYVLIVNHTPSSVRAFLMIAFFWITDYLMVKSSQLNNLLLSGVAILLWNPMLFWNIGFQLSYAIVLGLICFGQPLADFLNSKIVLFKYLPEKAYKFYHKMLIKLKSNLIGSICMCLAAVIISTPILLKYMKTVSLYGLFLNVILLPLGGLIITSGALSILLGLVGLSWLSKLVNNFAYTSLSTVDFVIQTFLSYCPKIFLKSCPEYNWVLDCLTVILLFLFLGFKFKSRSWIRKSSQAFVQSR